MDVFEMTPAALAARLSRVVGQIDAALAPPVALASATRVHGDVLHCEVTAQRLVPVDPDHPALRGIHVGIPIAGWIELARDGSVRQVSLPMPGPEEVKEARLFARDLIDQGAVRGLQAGKARPGARPTHGLEPDEAGRRIIRRIGFAGTAGPSPA